MAIHDTDPNTSNRARPLPQTADTAGFRHADGTTGITNKRDSSTGPYAITKDATIYVYDGTYTRIAIGLLPDGTYGMVVTKDGYNISDAFA